MIKRLQSVNAEPDDIAGRALCAAGFHSTHDVLFELPGHDDLDLVRVCRRQSCQLILGRLVTPGFKKDGVTPRGPYLVPVDGPDDDYLEPITWRQVAAFVAAVLALAALGMFGLFKLVEGLDLTQGFQ